MVSQLCRDILRSCSIGLCRGILRLLWLGSYVTVLPW